MKIVADENIPLLDYYFSPLGQLILKPGREIVRNDLLDADILLVRSVTSVNQALLEDTSVKFVGSTTTGSDHIDTVWLNQAGISWSIAEGCNSVAVVEYVLSVIALLQKIGILPDRALRAGIIGVGRIGNAVAVKLKELGFSVVLCDPFRMTKEKDFSGVLLEDFAELDFITLHTPLTYEGTYPTYHLIEKNFLQRQKKSCVLLNTSRGSVIDFSALKQYGKDLIWCLDVWENEPYIDMDVLQQAVIATPHIAGYSVQSKYRGIEMIYDAAIQQGVIPDRNIPRAQYPFTNLSCSAVALSDWRDVMLAVFNPLVTTVEMKKTLTENSNQFDKLRKELPLRHELEFVKK
ncbi:MAG: 4-phosphoerythronate dehydrogenase [Gammaproteobacteria bacterium]|nr:4-phosphoerythronate dehydrogenase [Gammaproteobacteria bacterium]